MQTEALRALVEAYTAPMPSAEGRTQAEHFKALLEFTHAKLAAEDAIKVTLPALLDVVEAADFDLTAHLYGCSISPSPESDCTCGMDALRAARARLEEARDDPA